jgi:diguanylate cyclase (GGDEF)-like protein/PAS domain S-box-containing protein
MSDAEPLARAISILIVEDSSRDATALRQDLFAALPTHSLQIREAASAAMALRLANRHPFDIVISNLGLPDSQGLKTVRTLRAGAPMASIILLTSLDDENAAVAALMAGAEDYLVKGKTGPDDLRRALRFALARRHFKHRQFHEADRIRSSLDSIADAVITVDEGGRVEYMNSRAEQLTGWMAQEAMRRSIESVVGDMQNLAEPSSMHPVSRALLVGASEEFHEALPLQVRGGENLLVEISITPLRGRLNPVTGAVLLFRDVTSGRVRLERHNYQSQVDSLTGLMNRSEFERVLGRLCSDAQRNQHQHALLLIDLDGFRQINEAMDSTFGDQLLKTVAQRISACVRRSDTSARLGGDQFAVLLEECKLEQAQRLANKIIEHIAEQPKSEVVAAFSTGASIGLCMVSSTLCDVDAVLEGAHRACREAKKMGGRIVKVFGDLPDLVVESRGGE